MKAEEGQVGAGTKRMTEPNSTQRAGRSEGFDALPGPDLHTTYRDGKSVNDTQRSRSDLFPGAPKRAYEKLAGEPGGSVMDASAGRVTQSKER